MTEESFSFVRQLADVVPLLVYSDDREVMRIDAGYNLTVADDLTEEDLLKQHGHHGMLFVALFRMHRRIQELEALVGDL